MYVLALFGSVNDYGLAGWQQGREQIWSVMEVLSAMVKLFLNASCKQTQIDMTGNSSRFNRSFVSC